MSLFLSYQKGGCIMSQRASSERPPVTTFTRRIVGYQGELQDKIDDLRRSMELLKLVKPSSTRHLNSLRRKLFSYTRLEETISRVISHIDLLLKSALDHSFIRNLQTIFVLYTKIVRKQYDEISNYKFIDLFYICKRIAADVGEIKNLVGA